MGYNWRGAKPGLIVPVEQVCKIHLLLTDKQTVPDTEDFEIFLAKVEMVHKNYLNNSQSQWKARHKMHCWSWVVDEFLAKLMKVRFQTIVDAYRLRFSF